MLPSNVCVRGVSVLVALVALCASAMAQPAPTGNDEVKRLEMLTGLKVDAATLEAERNASAKIRNKINATRRSILERQGDDFVGGKPTFSVGFNGALEKKQRHLAGSRMPANDDARFGEREAHTQAMAQREQKFAATLQARGLITERTGAGNTTSRTACVATADAFDWRDAGKVTPVRNQSSCGSCWAFATAAALESSYLIRNNQTIKVSEQHLLSCSRSGSCDGGWHTDALDKLIGTGVADGTAYPYTTTSAVCEVRKATPYHWSNWGLVGKTPGAIPKPAEIKQALCAHGPLITTVKVTDSFIQYQRGVLNERIASPRDTNHAVVIVGWDDARKAWLIKNSWGSESWGKLGGYAWVEYGAHNIGVATAWVQASKDYVLKDKCSTFDADAARVRRYAVGNDDNQHWVIAQGDNIIRFFGKVAPPGADEDPNEDDARLALTLMRHYKINRNCNTASTSDDAAFRYWLVGNKPPAGPYRGEDCVDIEWQRLDVSQEGADWVLSDGTSQLEVFDGRYTDKTEEAAWLAYAYLKKHRMTKMCYFSRRDTSLRYYRQ